MGSFQLGFLQIQVFQVCPLQVRPGGHGLLYLRLVLKAQPRQIRLAEIGPLCDQLP